jgi:hypothetical protein
VAAVCKTAEITAIMVEMAAEENQEQVQKNKNIKIKDWALESKRPLYTKSVSLFFIAFITYKTHLRVTF